MKFILLTFLLAMTICLSGFVSGNKASAAASTGTKARLHILTLECVLEKINNGITDIHLLTPADCKKKIESVSPVPFTGSANVSAIPLPQQNEPFATESSPGSSSVVIEDLETGLNAPKPENNLILKIASLIFQAVVFISLVFLLGYIFMVKLFEFL